MKRIQSKISIGLLVLSLFAVLSACKKIKEPEAFIPDRVFTPASITATGGETAARISWRASNFSAGKGVTYRLEVSRTAGFTGAPVYTTDTDTTEVIITDAELEINVDYYARVKGNATQQSAGSAGWVATTTPFRITGEQLFLPVNDNTLTSNGVVLEWRAAPDLTHIVLTPAGGTPTDYPLLPADLAATQKAITGLTPLTQYTAEIFRGAMSKGTISFTTKTDRPTGPNVVIVGPAADLKTLLETAAPGAIFVLEQNTVYNYDDIITLPNNAAFTIWGDNGPNKPVLAFNGFNLPATAGTIRFENVDFTGFRNNDPSDTKRNYIFNQSTASVTEAIIFENCTVRNFVNTPLRLQGSNTITINRVVFNKSIAFDCGDNNAAGTYAFVHTNVATGRFNNIEITNSTLYKIGYSVILHNLAPSQSVIIESCTFDNSIGNGRYLIDYNAQPITGSFQFNNNIVGKTLSPLATARGIRAGSAPSVSNSYQTSDAVFAGNAIPGINPYTGSSTDLFTDPGAGNFLIKDNNFAGRSTAGDPRWRL